MSRDSFPGGTDRHELKAAEDPEDRKIIVGDATQPERDPSPAKLYEQTGGGDAYRVAMLERGYIYPTAPWARKTPGKRVMQCGLVHEFDWSPWQKFSDAGREYEGRWCRTCATTQAREVPNA